MTGISLGFDVLINGLMRERNAVEACLALGGASAFPSPKAAGLLTQNWSSAKRRPYPPSRPAVAYRASRHPFSSLAGLTCTLRLSEVRDPRPRWLGDERACLEGHAETPAGSPGGCGFIVRYETEGMEIHMAIRSYEAHLKQVSERFLFRAPIPWFGRLR
jgi:hypothetical protein